MTANDCFICLQPLNNGESLTVVGLGFIVHQSCADDEEE